MGFVCFVHSLLPGSGVALPSGEWRAFAPTTYLDPVLLARLPAGGRCWTLYHATGDVLGWLCVALSVLVLLLAVLPEAVLGRLLPRSLERLLVKPYDIFSSASESHLLLN